MIFSFKRFTTSTTAHIIKIEFRAFWRDFVGLSDSFLFFEFYGSQSRPSGISQFFCEAINLWFSI